MWKKAVQSQEETEKILRSTEGENRNKRAQVFKIIIDAENKQWYTECNTDGRTELMELYVTKNQKNSGAELQQVPAAQQQHWLRPGCFFVYVEIKRTGRRKL